MALKLPSANPLPSNSDFHVTAHEEMFEDAQEEASDEAVALGKRAFGFSSIDAGVTAPTTDFPALNTPPGQRRGITVLPFSRSPSLELEGYGDLKAARAILEPMGLVPEPTATGQARVSIATIRYRFVGGLMTGTELWLSIVARPKAGGPPGQAYLVTVADKAFLQKIGEGFGIPYERAPIELTPNRVAVGTDVSLVKASTSARPTLNTTHTQDFPGFSPTGGVMEVHMQGSATRRAFDPAADQLTLSKTSAIGALAARLQFQPKLWTSMPEAAGGIRARAGH